MALGSIASVASFAWYLLVIATWKVRWPFPSNILSIETLFLVWAATMYATFHRSKKRLWSPVLVVTSFHLKVARVAFVTVILNAAAWLLFAAGLWVFRKGGYLPVAFCAFMSSCALINSVYVTIHWAFRPENLFSERARGFADDPLIFLLFEFIRKRKPPNSTESR